jgi:hypothetical protein
MTDLVLLLATFSALLAGGYALANLADNWQRRHAVRAGAQRLVAGALRDHPGYRGTTGAMAPHLCLLVHPGRRRVLVVSPLGAREIGFEQIWSVEVQTDTGCVAVMRRKGGLSRARSGAEAASDAMVAAVSGPVTTLDLVVRSMDPDFPVMRWNLWAPHGLIRRLEPWQMAVPLAEADALQDALRPVFDLLPLPMGAPQRIALRGQRPSRAPRGGLRNPVAM